MNEAAQPWYPRPGDRWHQGRYRGMLVSKLPLEFVRQMGCNPKNDTHVQRYFRAELNRRDDEVNANDVPR